MDTDNKNQANENLRCEYCNKQYKQQVAFEKHLCEKKKRVLLREEKSTKLSLHLFNEFYRTQLNSLKQYSFDFFEKSPYYKAFIKFGEYCYNSKIIAADQFLQWLIKQNIPVDRWASDQQYNKFFIEYLREEPAVDALERAIKYSIVWAEKKNMPSHVMLRYMTDLSLVYAIQNGKVSPWILYMSKNGQKRLATLEGNYLDGVWEYIDPSAWNTIIANRKDEADYLKSLLIAGNW
jgi:hypothetical protein